MEDFIEHMKEFNPRCEKCGQPFIAGGTSTVTCKCYQTFIAQPIGWICPVCGAGLSPFALKCDCKNVGPQVTY